MNLLKKKKLINWFCLSGLISILFYFLHDVIGAQNYPGYNWLSQAVSDLTATDAAAGHAIVPKEYFGFVERFSTYSAVIYTGILGLYGFGKSA